MDQDSFAADYQVFLAVVVAAWDHSMRFETALRLFEGALVKSSRSSRLSCRDLVDLRPVDEVSVSRSSDSRLDVADDLVQNQVDEL